MAAVPMGELEHDPFEEKLLKVVSWLKKIYGDKPIPKYEVTERTLDILHGVMEYNEERDKDVSLLIEDMKDQANKCEEEAKYWQDILEENLYLDMDCLSQEATTAFNDLVACAMALEVKDTSLNSFYSAISYMTSELFKTESENEEMELKLKTLTEKITSALMMEKQLKKDIKKIEEYQEAENAKLESQSTSLEFLECKSEDLKIKIRDAEEKLIATGLDQTLTHEALVKLSEELAALWKVVEPLKKEVKAYQCLPPNIALARVEIEEAKRELEVLDKELSKQIDAVPFELT